MQQETSHRHVLVASMVGASIEWYDFYIYGIAAALVFGPRFFPSLSTLAGTLAAFATFGVGFLARPIGAAAFGHYGDRIGRKSALVVSLLLMGLGTFAVGLLPDYDSIGVWAPILLVLLRFIQGIGIGGEWGGAALLAAEYAPDDKRGAYVGWPQFGTPAGLLLSNAVFLLVRGSMTAENFGAWGWRIPFLASIVLVIVGVVIRTTLHETPVFKKLRAAGQTVRAPLIEVFQRQPRTVFLVAGAFLLNNTAFFLVTVFTLAYARGVPAIASNPNIGLIAQIVGGVTLAIGIVFFSALSDRIGRKRTIVPLYLCWLVWVWPMFWLIGQGSLPSFVLAVAVGTFLTSAYGPLGAFLLEQFETDVRYTGAGVGQQIGAIFGGGLGPLLATQLNAWGGVAAVQGYVCIVVLISVACVMLLRDATGASLAEIDGQDAAHPLPAAGAITQPR